jgi:EAL domain-containing protein (putative c-di-GMP-specific phosphodiesterase class I)
MKASEQRTKEGTARRLTDAITRDHFILYGQPIVSTGAARERPGYIEILVRYIEEERNLLPPGGFFEVLESLNLMSVLDFWVLNRVLRSLAGQCTVQENCNVPRYSVNLSVDSLYEAKFSAFIIEHFRANRLPRGKLWLEIAERDAKEHAVALENVISNLRPIGCGFALTSYSGDILPPASLQHLGVDTIKIDGQIIGDINRNVAASARVKAIHLMCKKLRIQTVGEMVEYPEILEKLKKLGIDYAQGYAVAPPAPLRTMRTELH